MTSIQTISLVHVLSEDDEEGGIRWSEGYSKQSIKLTYALETDEEGGIGFWMISFEGLK